MRVRASVLRDARELNKNLADNQRSRRASVRELSERVDSHFLVRDL